MIIVKWNYDDHLSLIEFAYNNNCHLSILMSSYKALYGKRYRFSVGWFDHGESWLIGTILVNQDIEKVKVIQERLKMIKTRQKSYKNVRKIPLEFEVDDWVYFKVSPMKGVMRFV